MIAQCTHTSSGRRIVGLLIALLVLVGLRSLHAQPVLAAGPTMLLEPAYGPCGIHVLAKGRGWLAGTHVQVQRGGDNGPVLADVRVARDGTFAVPVLACDPVRDPKPVGYQQPVVAVPDYTTGGPPVRVYATFTVTTSGPVRLPAAAATDWPWPVAMSILGGLMLVGGLHLRRRRPNLF
ncbi:MAG: hypothetical protein H0X37_02210 [Herpetosiphonaceae bacterium]|nr:hypothetical protein [Herpetosiphonaceae bacterium]